MPQLILIPLMALAIVAGLVLLAILAVVIAATVGRARLRRLHRPTGQLVAAAGTRLHVVRRGPAEGPTVVLVAGVGGVAAGWAAIQARLDGSIGSLAYDRAGLGWSGPARRPRTMDALADELRDLLDAEEVEGPVVVVGHSLGGIVARRLAVRHPGSVAGLVLVDSAHEAQYAAAPEVRKVARRMASLPGPIVRLMGALSVLRRPAPDPRLDLEATAAVRAATVASPTHLPTAMAEMRSVVRGDGAAGSLGHGAAGSLGDLPLMVLRHGRRERMPMLTDQANDRFEAVFAELQGELAALSTRGRLVVAEGSGHDIHLDDPELVVAAIEEVVAAARAAGAAAASASSRAPHRTTAAADAVPSRPARLGDTLRAIARPMLILTAALLAGGSILAAAGLDAGWLVYLAGYASAVVTIPALAAVHRGRIGRAGLAAFGLATIAFALGTPVVAMVATFVLRIDPLHLALMPYALSLPGMLGAFGVNLAVVIVGVVVIRAAVLPAAVGWLLAGSAIIEAPVELGLLPLPVWALAMTLVAVAFVIAARALGPARRLEAHPVVG